MDKVNLGEKLGPFDEHWSPPAKVFPAGSSKRRPQDRHSYRYRCGSVSSRPCLMTLSAPQWAQRTPPGQQSWRTIS